MATAIAPATANPAPFRPAIMQALTPSEIPGAYLSPAPPPNFHPDNESPAALLKRGFFWRRPTPDSSPDLKQAWNTHFGPDFHVGQWLVPKQVVRRDRVHRPVRRHIPGKVENEIFNWGGGVLFGGPWTSCNGTWTVPTVSKPTEPAGSDGGWDSTTWVGLGGGDRSDLLQAGTGQEVDGNGNASYYAWYEWVCTVQRQTLSDISPCRPAVGSFNGNLVMAYTGQDNQQLNVVLATGRGQIFGPTYVSPQYSPFAPALCEHEGNLFIAWTGTGEQQVNIAQVLFGSDGNPNGIATPVTLNSTSEQGPSLASFNGNLYVAFIGTDNQQINVVVSTDGGLTYPPQYKHISAETSPDTPNLVVHQNQLFVGWVGDGNDQLNVSNTTFNGPAVSSLSNVQVLGATSPFAPSLASNGTTMYLAWRGDGNDQLNLMQSADGVTFTGWYVSPESSTDAPTITFAGPDLFVGWKGDNNNNLNASLVGIINGGITGFTTPDYFYEVTIPNFPVNPGDSMTCSALYTTDKSAGQITFSNTTQNVSFSITLVPPPGAVLDGASGEWIMEVPTLGDGSLAHLPNFTPFSFTGASTCGASSTGDAQNATIETILNDNSLPLTDTTLGSYTVALSYVTEPQ